MCACGVGWGGGWVGGGGGGGRGGRGGGGGYAEFGNILAQKSRAHCSTYRYLNRF